ncbi:MAG TPA: HU family DNA-binding protein [Blastocatellia bacterium]|jgi:nucleoid DNA-binding protein
MNKSDLIREAARRAGINVRQAGRGVEATLEIIARELGQSHEVNIEGLGQIKLKLKRADLLPPPGSEQSVESVADDAGREESDSYKIQFGGDMKEKKEDASNETDVADTAIGLDVGTSRVVMATGSAENARTMDELNAFITLPYSKLTERIFKQKNVPYQLNGGTELQVYGNEAARFANVFNIEVRRPMSAGTLNPTEEQSMNVLQSIFHYLLVKAPKTKNLRFSVPGELSDGGSSDLVYHEAMLKKTIDAMGYNSKAVNEGLAVVFAELESENFTGIGISCGGGMCNVALAFMSMPVITFSTTKAGDYIDQSVASVTGETANSVRTIKESSLDLARAPQNKYEEAFHTYYENLINSLVDSLRAALADTKNLPKITEALPIVLSGGTACPHGFDQKFRKAIEREKFPLRISEIRMASDPLTATARGCLIAAMYDA